MTKYWMVRAGRSATLLEDFLGKAQVTVGGPEFDLSTIRTPSEALEKVAEFFPDWKQGKKRMWASQLYRFAHDMKMDDKVLTYDPQQRVYHIGVISSEYHFTGQHPHSHSRKIRWIGHISRDDLKNSTKNSLGAISTLFQIPNEAGLDIQNVMSGNKAHPESKSNIEEKDDDDIPIEDIEDKAIEFIKDQLSKLDWEEMQELVAGTLRAMGYKTRVSPSGPDRGKDIIASPDGFGFENPRIIVEVKHRESSPMGSHVIRSFLGGRHHDDKGLFVSTGGFTKDAYYEAERAKIPLTLMNLDDLVKALVDNYENLDIEIKQLIPLKKIFWPV